MEYELGIKLDRIEQLVTYLVEEYEKGKKKPTNKQEEEDKVR